MALQRSDVATVAAAMIGRLLILSLLAAVPQCDCAAVADLPPPSTAGEVLPPPLPRLLDPLADPGCWPGATAEECPGPENDETPAAG